ncbi:MAG: response regulator [Verrucomicrobiota bacterium]|jgi:DNA-binding response OmpR family regulator
MNTRRRHFILCGIAWAWAGAAPATTLSAAALHEGEVRFDHIQTLQYVAAGLAIALAGFLILKKLARPTLDFLAGELGLIGFSAAGQRERLAEEEDFARFITGFRAGPSAAPRVAPPDTGPLPSRVPTGPLEDNPESGGPESQSGRDPLGEFFAWAPEQVGALQKLVERSGRPENSAGQRDLLVEVCGQITALKERASLPELRPAWQLAAAIEGLLKQLTGRVSNITHSTQRTVAESLELLEALCAPGVRADLAVNPAIRILAVDDDQVSRFALRAAVRKAFGQPDLAESGEAALTLARLHSYDLVLLDVMMPGMDGFEVCTRIRETAPNGSTPVLFVTALKDFDTRAKSLTVGGNGLLGKPFLTFEITLKALTLVLRARLRERNRILEASGRLAAASTPAVHWPELGAEPVSEEDPAPPAELSPGPDRAVDQAGAGPIVLLPPPVFAAHDAASDGLPKTSRNVPRELSPAFLTYMRACVREMKDQITLIGGLEEDAARKELLVRLHLRLQSLSRRLDLPELRPAFELGCALEGLSKKLRDDPSKANASTLRTAAIGLGLLRDLCAPGVRPDLSSNPPIRILVVDDDPVARRALTGALQMAFSRPDGAESGEAALGLAVEKEFDLVFLDVCMPVMDGFTVCARIHETVPNRSTPVVFVTSHSDEEFRAQSERCGARDFVVKPFVFMEIPVKALTYALRGRLEKLKMTRSADTAAPAKSAGDNNKT